MLSYEFPLFESYESSVNGIAKMGLVSDILGRIKSWGLCIRARHEFRVVHFLWTTFAAILIASKCAPPPLLALKTMIVTYAMTLSVYIFNDAMDVETDKITNPSRPIVQGRASREDAIFVAFILALASLLLSFSINVETFLLCVSFLTLGFLYSAPIIYLKEKSLIVKSLVPAIGGGISGIIGGTSMGVISPRTLYVGFMFFMIVFGGVPLMDLKDIESDKLKKIKTIPIIYGPTFAIKMIMATMVSLAVITIIAYPWLGFNYLAPAIMTFACLTIAFLLRSLFNNWQNSGYISKTLRRIMTVSPLLYIGLILGSL